MAKDPERIDWRIVEPLALAREKEEMARLAADMTWRDDLPAGGWSGLAPPWPVDLIPPKGLELLLNGRRLDVGVAYTQGFPMAPPDLFPLDPRPEVQLRARHDWHLNSDGSLCLLFTANDWPGNGTAANLVEKAAGWFVEYLARKAGLIETMSEHGPLDGHPQLEEALARLTPPTSS
jgi:hypothetical protein